MVIDPNETWNDMLHALKRKKWDVAEELAFTLHDWLLASKRPPLTVGDEALGKRWHTTIASFVCLFVIGKVKKIRKRRNKKKGGTS